MITAGEVRRLLNAAIERQGMSRDRERMAKYALNAIVPEVLKIVAEQVRAAKRYVPGDGT